MDNSCFSKLPAELRNHIWQLAVIQPPVHITFPLSTNNRRKDPYIQPPITRVCKQIRTECLPMFFALNTFRIAIRVRGCWSDFNIDLSDQLRAAKRWVATTKAEHHAFIRHIGVEILTGFDASDDVYRKEGYFAHANEWNYNCFSDRRGLSLEQSKRLSWHRDHSG